ncbi:MAG: putative transport system ATP-binding protein [Frankiaceae bacterium]|nr:putative transport system ATP-binding protein [Frankiaceae bacterium]
MTSPLLTATNLSAGYRATTVVREVSLTLRAGDQVALLGRSGSGKTTLLLAMAGLVPPSAGVVDRHSLSPRDVAVVFQSPSLIAELTSLENVVLPLRLSSRLPASEAYDRARRALDSLGVDAVDALPGQMSGGQQQRVAVARVLATDAQVIFADEPTGSLDATHARAVLSALRTHCTAQRGALVLATHDAGLAAALPTTWRLDEGRLHQVVPC